MEIFVRRIVQPEIDSRAAASLSRTVESGTFGPRTKDIITFFFTIPIVLLDGASLELELPDPYTETAFVTAAFVARLLFGRMSMVTHMHAVKPTGFRAS